jgi:hypothetical protein
MLGRGVRRSAAAAVALFLLLLGAPAALAAPRPGERYDGKSATGQRIFVSVSEDGGRLDRYTFAVNTNCTDGERRLQGTIQKGETATTIDAAGSFSHQSRVRRGFYSTSSGRVNGRFRTTFSGTFDATGDSVTGTIESTFQSDRFDCSSGPVAYTIYRDGTPQAPFRDSVMATGLYTAAGKGVAAKFRTLAPGRELVRGEISYRARCRSGGNLRSGRIFLNYLLSENGRRSIPGVATFRIRQDNVSVRVRFRLTLRFFQSGGHKVTGTWSVRAAVSRRGRQIDTCRLKKPLEGAFKSGPA